MVCNKLGCLGLSYRTHSPAVDSPCNCCAGTTSVLQEPLGVLRATLEAVLETAMPPGCTRSVYLCDDGADPQKRTYVATISHLGVM